MHEPAGLLRWLSERPEHVSLANLDIVDIWGLVGLAAQGREGGATRIDRTGAITGASRFAHAVGFDDVLSAGGRLGPAEDRTVRLKRIRHFEEIEPTAAAISRLIVPVPVERPELEETQRTVYYVLVELLRNVVQHSQDPLGGVVAAQRMVRPANEYPSSTIQVAVADAGIGIPATLRGHHGDLDPEAALDRALWPHVSGTFRPGETGTTQNAGLGLFFIAEMAKRTAGRLLVASREATLSLVGDTDGRGRHHLEFLRPKGLGYPGTFVGFELREGEVRDHEGLLETIRAVARERAPRLDHRRWLRFETPPAGVVTIRVQVAAEDTSAAEEYARDVLTPRLMRRTPLALDFQGWSALTQSYAHALLYEPVRLAWALKQEVYVTNARPGVQSALEFLESYALAG